MAKKLQNPATWWNSQTSKQKRYFIIALIFSIIILALSCFVLTTKEIGLTAWSNYLFGEGNSGWYWLSQQLKSTGAVLLQVVIIAALAFMISFIVNLIIGLITWRGKRSKTIGSLFKSLIKYAITIISIGFILRAFGIDVASIVAGIGIITLIIGLGCQSLISDIVSGVFLVFDDFFDVGDVVVIDGFRGTISEIGLRSTKVQDWAGNIKSINNSQIISVTNLSRLATSIVVNFVVGRNEDVQHVEAVIAEALPLIKKKLPKVIGPISYIGVSNLKESGIELAFSLTCNENDRYQINRDMTRELLLVMREHQIEVPFSSTVIYKKDEKVGTSASEEEKKTAEELIKKNR